MNLQKKAVLVALASCLALTVFLLCFFLRGKTDPLTHREGPSMSVPYREWATAIDEHQCTDISKNLYSRGATVADVAVATLLCLGVVLPESLGIGGGFLAIYFRHSTGTVHFLDARETAPNAATRDMFIGKANRDIGPESVAVPGEIRGYRELLDFIGSNVTQRDIFETAIRLARDGFVVGKHMERAMEMKRDIIYASDELRKLYFDEVKNSTRKFNETIHNPFLAETLEKLAASNDFAKEFYEGSVGEAIVDRLKAMGGLLTREDLASYKALWKKPTHSTVKDKFDVYSAGLSGSGAVLSMMVNIMDTFNADDFAKETRKTYHRLVEAMKFAYAKRSLLGDDRFVNTSELIKEMQDRHFAERIRKKISDTHTLPLAEYGGAQTEAHDQGTSHANFFAPNGDVLAITSTINYYFGSGVQIEGIILNNEMDDFSTPNETNGFGLMPSESNFIEPGKRPMSSMAPTVIVERNGKANMAIGGAGGSKITTALAEFLLHYLYQGYNIGDAIAHSRVHHQYIPNRIVYDQHFDPDIIKGLQKFGHETYKNPPNVRGSVVVAIAREGPHLIAAIDPRKGGGSSGGRL